VLPEEILIKKCRELVDAYEEVERLLSDPSVYADQKRMVELSRKRKSLSKSCIFNQFLYIIYFVNTGIV